MKVLLGLSGGVDSAVAAYLLKQAGHEVETCFMRNWDSLANNDLAGNPTLEDEICPQESDYQDALSVAQKLGLPLSRVDYSAEYWDHVFEHFLSEYRKGRTPNPDVLCNKYIKFDAFFKYAMERGFDAVATGHYAQVRQTTQGAELLRACDENKDQSYFLCQVPREALAKTLFPIGGLEKHEVRRIAEELGLSVAKKKDSTGICFIGERQFRAFLQNYLPMKPGDLIEAETGKLLGQHEGVFFYTIGQRKGLGIGGAGSAWFVQGKDVQTNRLFVSQDPSQKGLYSKACRVEDFYWIAEPDTQNLSAKFRYRQQDQPVYLEACSGTSVKLSFETPVRAVTEGQYAVLYEGERCLGGGVIEEVYF